MDTKIFIAFCIWNISFEIVFLRDKKVRKSSGAQILNKEMKRRGEALLCSCTEGVSRRKLPLPGGTMI